MYMDSLLLPASLCETVGTHVYLYVACLFAAVYICVYSSTARSGCLKLARFFHVFLAHVILSGRVAR